MVRTHITALVALLTLFSANFALAFGLGELTLKSYLNQPFVAEIEILELGDLTQDEIIPKLASPKDFANVGLQRDFFLTELKFEVVLGQKSGRNYILVTTNEPVTEPFLDFLVEFLWPEGRLLREYTVLLDPPSYAAQSTQEQSVPVVAVSSSPVNEQPVVANSNNALATQEVLAEQYQAQPDSEQASNVQATNFSRRTITTEPKDTLWSIAARERPVENVSVQQTMLAIQELNPEAFQYNNINYLKKNQVLRIPTEDEIRSLAAREALGLVADQNREWAGRTLASGGTLPVDTAKLVGSRQVSPMGEGEVGDQMKLVADMGEDGEAVGTYAGTGSGANADEATRASRQAAQLLAETKALKSQVETSEKLISLKDQQIAELQAKLAEKGVDASTSLDDEVNNVIERVAVAEVEEEISLDSEAMSEEEEIAQAMAQAQSDAASEANVESSNDFANEDAAPVEAEEEISFETKEVPAKAEALTSAAPNVDETESSQTLLFVVIGVVILLVLGGLGFFLYKKRVTKTDSYDALANNFPEDDEGFEGIEGFGDAGDISDDAFGDDADSDGENVLTEAETYISFNRYTQAVELLKNAIASGNDSIEVKIKLLEAYAGLGDQGAFDNLSEEVLNQDESQQTIVDELASQMKGNTGQSFDMDATTRMNASDFDLDTNSNEDEFDISLDDLANDLDASFSSDDEEDLGSLDLSEEFAGNSDEDSSELDLDDTLVMQADTAKASEDDGLDLELDDLSFDDDSSTELETESGGLDLSEEEGLDLDDTLVMHADDDKDAEEDDGLELDLDDLSFDDEDSEATESSSLDLSDEDDGLDLDFDMDDEGDLDSDTATHIDTVVEAADELDVDLDFDVSEEEDLDLGEELSFDEPDVASTNDDELDLSNDLDLDGDLNLEEDLASEPEDSSSDDSLFGDSDSDDFELPDDGDEAATKLDLARAYIDMGDEDGAKDILEEVVAEGDASQKAEAKELLAKL